MSLQVSKLTAARYQIILSPAVLQEQVSLFVPVVCSSVSSILTFTEILKK